MIQQTTQAVIGGIILLAVWAATLVIVGVAAAVTVHLLMFGWDLVQ